jgi:hypothetical protein
MHSQEEQEHTKHSQNWHPLPLREEHSQNRRPLPFQGLSGNSELRAGLLCSAAMSSSSGVPASCGESCSPSFSLTTLL